MPPSLLEWVPEDHLAWTILASVEEMDLGALYADYRPDGHGRPAYSVSRKAADILIAAGIGRGSPAEDWLKLAAVVAAALGLSLAAFAWTGRSRT